MENISPKKLFRQVRSNIIAGILLIIPLLITLIIILKLFRWVDSALPLVLGVEWGTGIGITVTLVLAYFAGLLAKNYFGKKLIDTGNAIICNIPILNKVYLGVQQVVDTVSLQNKKVFDRVVLVQYPKEKVYCIAFVTSNENRDFSKLTGHELISVFVPTTPNPTSGYLLYYPKEDMIDLDMPVELAIKRIMSAGLLNGEQINAAKPAAFNPMELLTLFKRNAQKADPVLKSRK
ncbi:Transporter [Chitinispirillum alkaliphilum]|nr:Transporter [Chitinispirillum alkaliphilum]